MNKSIIIISIIIVTLAGLMWLGKSTQGPVGATTLPANGSKSLLTATETLYDFGTISMKDGNVTKDFTVTNTTDKDIFVPTLVTSCMCTKAFIVESDGSTKGPFGMPGMAYVPPANETIKAGESRTFRAVYDPNAHGPAGVGFIDRFLILTDASGGTLRLGIKAVVTP